MMKRSLERCSLRRFMEISINRQSGMRDKLQPQSRLLKTWPVVEDYARYEHVHTNLVALRFETRSRPASRVPGHTLCASIKYCVDLWSLEKGVLINGEFGEDCSTMNGDRQAIKSL